MERMRAGRRRPGWSARVGMAALLALPGAATAYTAFAGGGYFAGTQAVLVIAATALLAAWIVFARDPLAGGGWMLAVAAGALALLAALTLLSAGWSHAPARAVIEFDRALLYLLTLVLFGLLPMTRDRLRWMVRGLALALAVVCGAGLASRTLPALVGSVDVGRLAYPVGYSNALGLVGALGVVLATYLTTSEREPRAARILGAAAVPLFVATVYLTLARGAIAAGAVGVVAYLLLGRPRLFLTGLAAALPAGALAARAAAGADALTRSDPATALAAAQGERLARAVLLCCAGAAALRGVLALVDRRVVALQERWVPPRAALGAALAAALVLVVGFAAVGGPGQVQRQYRAFVERPVVRPSDDLRRRLTDPSGSGRADFWRVALDGYRSQPLHGHGAGTYELLWHRGRPYLGQLYDGHSLYLETLAELGLVGLALVLVAIGTLLAGVARRVRGLDRTLFAGVLAALLTWALHAGIEWDWEMPALTLWVFAVGGAALATPVRLRDEPVRPPLRMGAHRARALVGLACFSLLVLPVGVLRSQRHLDRAHAAFLDNRCDRAAAEADASIRALGLRPEPHELEGYCAVRQGRPRRGVTALSEAVRLDPNNWQYHYGSALVRAAAGLDPRAEIRRAKALNPLSGPVGPALKAFTATTDRRAWRTFALKARLPDEVVPPPD